MEKIKSGKRRKNKKETPPSSSEEKLQECPVCFTQQSLIGFNSCEHRACVSCLQNYLQIEISEGRVDLRCPVCSESLWPVDLHRILGDAHPLLSKYEEFAVRRALAMDPDTRWCPTPDCGFAVIAAGCASCPRLKCQRPGCVTEFCYHCKQLWHPNQTCDIARMQRAPRAASISSQCSHHEEMKFCPRCQAPIMKLNDGSCNHMTCPVCGCEFCWLCMKEVSDLHYLSPSGCTFWGKKPWSRKKKLLWQLGTLVGAPLGITLMAGVAVPALIVGLPIWVGRKLYNKHAKKRRALRNAYIAGGVFGSVLISPLVAAVTVGLGVPILLAYVYGVIPVSLCRNSACVRSDSESSDVVPMETLKDTTPEALVEAALEAITRRDPSAWNAFRETEVTITIDPSTGKTEAQIHHELSESDVPSSSGLCHVETC